MSLAEGTYDKELVDRRGFAKVNYGSNRGLHVEFSMKPVHQEFESTKQNRPVFKDTPFILIRIPGGKSDIIRPVRLRKDDNQDPTPTDDERFPELWKAFNETQQTVSVGTPLDQWPALTMKPSLVQEFKGLGIHTVEQLATLSDGNATNMPMGFREWRQQAEIWLRKTEEGAPVAQLKEENEQLKADMASLKAQMAQLAKQREQQEKK